MLANIPLEPSIEVRGVNTPLTSFYVKIKGAYPLSVTANKNQLNRVFEEAALIHKNKKIVISCIEEPFMFASDEHLTSLNSTSWFYYLHSIVDKYKFDSNQIILLTSNLHATDSYARWCEEFNVKQMIDVKNQTKKFWIARLLNHGCKYICNTETKHASMFLGRPTLHKNYVLKWYLKCASKKHQNKMIGTFFYNYFTVPDEWHLTYDEQLTFDSLPGTMKDNIKHPTVWQGDDEHFLNAIASGLVNFCVDYHEFEDFSSYEHYSVFKELNTWWLENVLSEKLFRAIILKKPFLILGMPGSLQQLHDWGFKTFDGILFDEEYDKIENFYARADNVLSQIDKLLEMPFSILKEKVYSNEVQEVIEHNYNVAYEIYNNDEDFVNV